LARLIDGDAALSDIGWREAMAQITRGARK
jgi:hypothetical protein